MNLKKKVRIAMLVAVLAAACPALTLAECAKSPKAIGAKHMALKVAASDAIIAAVKHTAVRALRHAYVEAAKRVA